jgi:hypothetical protein
VELPAERPRRRRLHAVLVALGFAITAAFAYLAVRNAHLDEVWSALRESNSWWLAPAFALLVLAVLLRAVRWWSLFAAPTRPPLREVGGALLVGYLFNNVLPLRAGEAARVVALKRRAGTSRAETAATVVVERAYDLVALLALLFVIAPWLPEVTWLDAAAVLAAVLAAGIAATIAVVAIWGERPVLALLRPLRRVAPVSEERLERVAASTIGGLAGLRSPRIAMTAFAWTALSWIALAASCAALLEGFDTAIASDDVLLAGLLVVIATNLALVLPSSPAAIGVFEAATLVALGAYDVDDSTALSYALVLHALNLVPYLVVGAIVLRAYRRRRRTVPDPGTGP